MAPQTKPYGEWVSPITAEIATASASAFQDLKLHVSESGKETVFWLELRYDEGGRYVIMSQEEGSTEQKQWTPKEFNARTLVHEYGGGNFFVTAAGVLYFSNFKDQRLYKQETDSSTPEAVTPADCHWRYADGIMNDKTGMIYIVREDHSKVKSGQSREPTNCVVCINPATQQQTVLACGSDFYSTPRVTSDGTKICWTQWLHPNMPWDSTEVWIAQLNSTGDAVVDGTAKKMAGGEGISVMHPSWTNVDCLLYISDETDWWNLYHADSNGESTNLSPQEKELGGPAWVFHLLPYATNAKRTGEVAVSFGGSLSLLKDDGSSPSFATGFKNHSRLSYSDSGKIYCIASSPVRFTCVISVNTQDGKVEVIKECQKVDLPAGYYSEPTHIKFQTTDDQHAYGYYYPPTNKDYVAPQGELPPCLVKAHGGPTSSASQELQLKIQYFTSRGFAVLDTNYRGSTGYGRRYRNQLRLRWGECDVEDCCAGALYLANDGKADKDRLCIDGGSAGGYTTLACLAFKDVFKAGASHYGVSDLELLAKETHKFESRYMDSMIGAYPEQKDVYMKRSPIHNLDGFKSPIIFFQGDEDAIVLPNQAEMMYASINEKKIPCSLVMFKGEQHSFRKSENIQTALNGELWFFSKVFGFVPPGIDMTDKIVISNLN